MTDRQTTLVLCTCDKTMQFDADALQQRGFDQVITTDQLCGSDLDVAVSALNQTQDVVFACEQQAQVFEQIQYELSQEDQLNASLSLIDLRDRAGWSAPHASRREITAKQAALLADAQLERPGTPAREVTSNGTCLIIAHDASVLPFAEQLGEELAVTCVLEQPPVMTAPSSNYDLATGKIRSIQGWSGCV
jgi:hypothetical protein